MASKNTAKVALVGLGTIGTGVARLLLQQQKRIARHAGGAVELVKVCDKDLTARRDLTLPDGILTDDLSQITDDPEISAVVQLIGGLEPARRATQVPILLADSTICWNQRRNCLAEATAVPRRKPWFRTWPIE